MPKPDDVADILGGPVVAAFIHGAILPVYGFVVSHAGPVFAIIFGHFSRVMAGLVPAIHAFLADLT
jgi:hypothetical protein